jgi:glycine betaine catabolism A
VTTSLLPTLPGHFYTDPAVFAAEQERVFEAMWFCAVRSSDVGTPGEFRTVRIGRESVLVTRNAVGEPRAFLNICRHRGSVLCPAEGGTVKRTFRCSYHAWSYDLDGRLAAAPNLVKMPDIDRVEFGLRTLHVREWLGYVWVCLSGSPPSFDEDVLGACAERLGDLAAVERYGIGDLTVGRRIRYDVRANWKLIIENFMECYHCSTIHPELVHVLPEFAGGYAAQSYVGHGAEFGPGVEGFTIDGGAGLTTIDGIAAEQDRRYFAVTIKPQVFLNLVPDHVILHRMFPLAADRTVVECDWLYPPEVVAEGRDLTRSVELFDRVNRQDFGACERCQPGMSSRAYANGGVLVPSEHHIAAFHEWVRDRLAA